jgi:hypothetical protein
LVLGCLAVWVTLGTGVALFVGGAISVREHAGR